MYSLARVKKTLQREFQFPKREHVYSLARAKKTIHLPKREYIYSLARGKKPLQCEVLVSRAGTYVFLSARKENPTTRSISFPSANICIPKRALRKPYNAKYQFPKREHIYIYICIP